MEQTELVTVLIQGGAVGLALVSIFGLIYALRMAFNHLSHTGEQLGQVAALLQIVAAHFDVRDDED